MDERGLPVANVSVGTVSPEKMAGAVTTAGDGSFELKLGRFMRMEEDLVARADDGRLMGVAKFIEPRNAGSIEPVRIVLKASRVTKVHVRDANDQPVAGATVAAAGFDYNTAATTDGGGEASLQIPGDAKVSWIVGFKAGTGFDYFETSRSQPAGEGGPLPAEVTIRLDGSRTVRVKAIDSAGRPVRGSIFRPGTFGSRKSLARQTLADCRSRGHEQTTRVWRLLDGCLRMLKTACHSLFFRMSILARFRRNTAAASTAVVLETRLLHNTRIGGIVRHADGRPAAGVLIRAEGRGATNHYCRIHTRTREDGTYAIDVYPDQSYLIAVLTIAGGQEPVRCDRARGQAGRRAGLHAHNRHPDSRRVDERFGRPSVEGRNDHACGAGPETSRGTDMRFEN